LTTNRKTFLVAQATVGTDINQPLNVHGDFLSEVSFNLVAVLDNVTDGGNFTL
jgi:hypothetical protein